ncbi:hypothetical protein E8E14_000593 [Neopestalotiopsis sp. 37M]|nr:hypothetical protein E8E14_000593 [Neopestalotiopsis sp. 37M]
MNRVQRLPESDSDSSMSPTWTMPSSTHWPKSPCVVKKEEDKGELLRSWSYGLCVSTGWRTGSYGGVTGGETGGAEDGLGLPEWPVRRVERW